MRKLLMLSFLTLALAACKDEEKHAAGGNASGEILPGSVSDAMLPLDTVKSQAPLAPQVESSEKGAVDDPKASDEPTAAAKESAEGAGAEPTLQSPTL